MSANIANKKRGQVWIETVLYTLIALALMSLVLGFVMPKINQTKDKLIVEQSVSMLNVFDEKINEVADNADSSRIFEFTIKRGELDIDAESKTIIFVLNGLSKPYSEAGVEIPNGPIMIKSEVLQKDNSVSLTLNYKGRYNITYNGQEIEKQFSPSQTPYTLRMLNKGITNSVQIDITSVS